MKLEVLFFFGGEPLLNLEIIEVICSEFHRLKEIGKIDYIPTFGIITNGTILNTKVTEIIKKYIKFITVSIDGPEYINDINRKFKNGTGSYKKINQFIRTIQKETNATIRYEATITKEHKLNNLTTANVIEYLKHEFQIQGSTAPDILHDMSDMNSANNNQELNIFKNGVITYSSEDFINIISSIVHNIYREMCPVGYNIIAVSVDGNMFPCHMNVGNNHLKIGSIYDHNIFDDKNIFIEKFPFLLSILKEKDPCISCWAKKICGGCTIRWFYNPDEKIYNNNPDPELCTKNKKYIEEIILEIVKVRKDKNKWESFINYLKSNDVLNCNYKDGH